MPTLERYNKGNFGNNRDTTSEFVTLYGPFHCPPPFTVTVTDLKFNVAPIELSVLHCTLGRLVTQIHDNFKFKPPPPISPR